MSQLTKKQLLVYGYIRSLEESLSLSCNIPSEIISILYQYHPMNTNMDFGHDSGRPILTTFTASNNKRLRWKSLTNMLYRNSCTFAPVSFDQSEDNLNILLEDFRILIVGTGALGCEILKNLALSGFNDIEIVDCSNIHLHNLSNQCLFRKRDIGCSKARIAAEFVMQRVPECRIKWFHDKIQEFDYTYFSKFNVVISAVDNVESIRWLNSTMINLVIVDQNGNVDPDSLIPLIVAETDTFIGKCNVFVPTFSSCFECNINDSLTSIQQQRNNKILLFPENVIFNPRTAEHCIAYSRRILWPQLESFQSAHDYVLSMHHHHNTLLFNENNIEHISWIYYRALQKAKEHNIDGVSFSLTKKVIQNIVPSVQCPNAIIAAVCCNETFKILSQCAFGLNDHFIHNYNGSKTKVSKKNPHCGVCLNTRISFKLDPNITFGAFYKMLLNRLRLKSATIVANGRALYFASKSLRRYFEENLNKTLHQLMLHDDTILTVTSPREMGKGSMQVILRFESGQH